MYKLKKIIILFIFLNFCLSIFLNSAQSGCTYTHCSISTYFDSSKGSITPTSYYSSVYVEKGSNQLFVITPNIEYEISGVMIDFVNQVITDTEKFEYTFYNVYSSHWIIAFFSKKDPNSVDNDNDGFSENQGDCNDNDPTIAPGKAEICEDGIDQDCSGTDQECFASSICVEISDIPLETQFQAAAPNIMLLMDNSGSMDWSFITVENDGKFNGYSYVFSNPGDNIGNYQVLPLYQRPMWKSQWSGYNKMYYNPNIKYDPWPNWVNLSVTDTPDWPEAPNANPNRPRSNPIKNDYVFNLDSTYCQIGDINIINAHYYVWSFIESKAYLIILDGEIKYYAVNNNGSLVISSGELEFSILPPADVMPGRTYAEERQNFANWYSFFRRRELTAKAALAEVIVGMEGVNIGMKTINSDVNQGVLPVKVRGEADKTGDLLEILYSMRSLPQGTPLRSGLKSIGQYYHQDDGLTGDIGQSPFAAKEDGGECQQSFTIVMTDGYYNGTSPNVGNTDGDNDTYFDGGCFGDNYSDTLADVAMKYYERDLSMSLDDLVPSNLNDEAPHQHMVTYGVSFGVFGTINPDQYLQCPTLCPQWPDNDTNQRRIDDMWHATVNGRGKYLSADNPQQLINALNNLKQDIENRRGSGASVTTNAMDLKENTVLYQTLYQTDYWRGDLRAYPIDVNTGAMNENYLWSSSEEMDLRDWDQDRKIISYNGSYGITFRISSLSEQQRISLHTTYQEAEKILNFLRGDDSNCQLNGGLFRNRSGKLGDLVHSAPILEDGILYVGGNDGMMHAFDSSSGIELFAYVPNLVYSNLRFLAEPSYTHKFYVDLTVYTKYINDTNQKLLVGGLAKGGKGYYCLDISTSITSGIRSDDEATIAGKIPIWEYPDSNSPLISPNEDDDLGYTFSSAYIINSQIGWVVIFGNGYDSVNGKAMLFVLDAFTGEKLKVIDTGIGNSTDKCNGLSSPALIDVNWDKIVDFAYAGDLLGNLWKFDLRSSNINDWKVYHRNNSDEPEPLFTAKSSDEESIQPITVRPDVMKHCVSRYKGYLILFGTGKYIGDDDFKDTSTQSIYAVWDWSEFFEEESEIDSPKLYYGSFMPPDSNGLRKFSNLDGKNEFGNLTLLQQTEIYFSDNIRVLSDNDIEWYDLTKNEGKHLGWYFDFTQVREKVIHPPVFRDGNALVISSIPLNSPCSAGGKSLFHEMDACSGGRLNEPNFDINNDNSIDDKDMINIGTEANPIMVAPTGKQFVGMIFPPSILSMSDKDLKFFSNSLGRIETLAEKKNRRGFFYWMEKL